MKLIVGLGNPGEKYAGNRHNVGFMLADRVHAVHGFAPWRRRFAGEAAEGTIGGTKCLLLKPSTYMNESGRAVAEAMRFFRIELGDVVVLHDEIDLEPGRVRVKIGGGNAGHNGLKSLTSHIGNDYMRLRIGVGRPADKADVANYVLRDFAKAEHDWLAPLIETLVGALPTLLDRGSAAFAVVIAKALEPAGDSEAATKKAPRRMAGAPEDAGAGKPAAAPSPDGTAAAPNAFVEKLKHLLPGKKDRN